MYKVLSQGICIAAIVSLGFHVVPKMLSASAVETAVVQAEDSSLAVSESTADHAADSAVKPADSGDAHADSGSAHVATITFVMLAILLLSAKIGGIVEKFDQPSVVGELAAGVVLSAIAYFGVELLDLARHNSIMAFLAELGAIILLFQVGLESNVAKLLQVGMNSVYVAMIGAILPFVLGTFLIGPLMFPEHTLVSHLFIGAALVATSVGIPATVFRSLKKAHTRPARTFLGATLIDDVLGLITLAIVSALAVGGEVTPLFIAILAGKAFGFLIIAIVLGNILAPYISRGFSMISTGTGMKMGIAFVFALLYAYLASLVGLAPIVGAFAAGLILDAVHFKSFEIPEIAKDLKRIKGFDANERKQIDELIEHHSHAHVEELISSISLILVPLFFVYTGLQVDFASLLQPELYVYAIIITIVAILGKVAAGFAAKGDLKEKLLVGVAMVPRGEVGLIFASVGKSLGALNDELFSIVVLVIILTTFVAPPLVKALAKNIE
jgi:Kef-type K+ transport system membrane component KefB